MLLAELFFWFFFLIFFLVCITILFYRFYFLRKPARKIPAENVLVSPANGRISRIIKIEKSAAAESKITLKKGVLGRISLLTKDVVKKGYLIVIVLTPFNVHFQRSPMNGAVEKIVYKKGLFMNAMKASGSLRALENERNEIIINNSRIGRIKVVQVAGFLARRIRCFVHPKQKVHKGEELGLICLGSQVLLVVPELKLCIREGQKVIDGETVVAKF
jgi:phosphatidylserine decarboxylase